MSELMPEPEDNQEPEAADWSEEEIEALADQIGEAFEDLTPEEAESLVRKATQDDVNDNPAEWRMLYGFDHECSCAEEASNGEFVEITRCYQGACEQAFDELRRARQFLFAIATSPSQEASTLRALAEEAFQR